MVSVDVIVLSVDNNKQFLIFKIHMDHLTKLMALPVNIFYQWDLCDLMLNFILFSEVKTPRLGYLVLSYPELIKNIFSFTKTLFEIVINGSLQHFISILLRSTSSSNPSSLILFSTSKVAFLSFNEIFFIQIIPFSSIK